MNKRTLDTINDELTKYSNISRDELFTLCIRKKLERTLETYNEDISKNSDFLLTKSSARVMKAITKLQKKDDKETIEKASEITESESDE